MIIEKKLAEMGITLPNAPAPVAAYTPCCRTGNLVFVSGQGPIINGQQMFTGKVGGAVSAQEGYQAARYCGYNLLAQLKNFLGDLDSVQQVVHVKGFVASEPDFTAQPTVINGVSELMVEVFGEKG
ncbi:MAG: RidA family protein, partial [Clostridia bacterium]